MARGSRPLDGEKGQEPRETYWPAAADRPRTVFAAARITSRTRSGWESVLNNLSHSLEASRDASGAAPHNHVTVGVEDFKRNRIRELVPVLADLDGSREPVCLYPGSSGAKNECFGHR